MKVLWLSILSFVSSLTMAADVVDISADEMLKQLNDDWLIIDVRSAEEYAEGHVPGAINISHKELADNLDKVLGHKDKPVVVYCRSGFRAGKAADILLKNDFSQVKHLDGDMKAWLEEGRDVEKP